MIKKKVDEKIAVADLYPVFLTDESEISSQFKNKIFQRSQKSLLQILFRVNGRKV